MSNEYEDILVDQDCRDSLPPLHALGRRFEMENASLLKRIMEDEEKSMEIASEKLQQYNKAGCKVQAVQSWGERQLRDARQDLKEARQRGEQHLNGLKHQLLVCDERLRNAQKDLQQLRDYRDRESAVRELQIADLQRQLQLLTDTQQDEAADVQLLAQTDLQTFSKMKQKNMDGILQSIVQYHMDLLPPSVRRMCLENQQMKQDIYVHKQVITELQEQLLSLQELKKSLQRAKKQETEDMCRDLLLHAPCCAPDEDVILDIPVNEDIPI
ncbi:uncharacterized protein C20orf96 homolog [Pelodytes ibericus]